MKQERRFDVVIIGSGHNGLVAACYLAKAGKKVLILEKNDYIGGATTSQRVFEDYDASLSRYSYLISLLPDVIIKELGLDLNLKKRKTASYTPFSNHGEIKSLLISNENEDLSRQSVLALGEGDSEWAGYQTILRKQEEFANLVWDSFLLPLKSRESWKAFFEHNNKKELWEEFVERPIGELIEKYVKNDILRGVLLTDARIGAYTSAHDESLLQNRTFIYHVIGNKTGEWRVPEGGMGRLSRQLQSKALILGASLETGREVFGITEKNGLYQVHYQGEKEDEHVNAEFVLLNSAISPATLLGDENDRPFRKTDEGTAFKINVLLTRLPALKDKQVSPENAFAGTFHVNQSYRQQEVAFDAVDKHGQLPEWFPFEIYCHTLTDPTILSPGLRSGGFHTFTAFGLDMAYALFEKDNEATKRQVLEKFFSGINAYLDEPLQDCIALDKNGNLCIEAKSAVDLENLLGMPRGNIFHRELQWFFAETEQEENQWGVETSFPRIFVCGSSAKRGGAVSGIPGRNAAMKILEDPGM